MQLQLYMHFPFCKRKCFYCDFCSASAAPDEVESYCRALETELRLEGRRRRDARVTTMFLGGGTPSIVPEKAMERVLCAVEDSFDLSEMKEFTSEANPGTLRDEWLDVMTAHGMNRLSLGVQAAQNRLLKSLGRIHTFEEAEQAVHMARKHGIRNLSMDLMFGLPGQTPVDYQETLDRVCTLEPEHISAYSLILEEGTPLYEQARKGQVQVPDEDETADLYQMGIERLDACGYHQYEISNFAKKDRECAHNIGYWQGAWYLGVGVSAHSMLPPEKEEKNTDCLRLRQANLNDRPTYVQALLEGREPPRQQEFIGRKESMFETMMLGLRMNRGVDGKAFAKAYEITLEQAYGKILEGLIKERLGVSTPEGGFALTARGMAVQNEVLLRFM